jgi:RNA polymerase sigma-70 factor (ECF subfamily)
MASDERGSTHDPAAGDAHTAPADQQRRLLLARGADVLLCAGGQGGLLRTVQRGALRLPIAAPRSVDAARVFEEFHESLLAFIARRVRDRDTAEDILQDVMLRIHRHAGELEHTSAIAAWVYQIARNAITDNYRRAAARPEQPVGIELGGDEAFELEPDENVARSEVAACLRPFLAELPAHHREALTLTELGELSQADAARRLGVSPSGMKSRVQRGREQLREMLVACCQIDLDRRARVTSYEPHESGGCGDSCGCKTAARASLG